MESYERNSLRTVQTSKNTASIKMKKPNGEYCSNDLENAEVFKNFYLKLYNNDKGTEYD